MTFDDTMDATDNVDGAIQATANYPSGYTFPFGLTVVTFTATDAAGNSAQVTMEITVIDMEAPVLTAPPDIEVFVDVGESFATVTFPMATAMDNVDDVGALTVISTLPSGSQFQTGDTVVFFIAEDSSGNDGMVPMNVRVLAPPP